MERELYFENVTEIGHLYFICSLLEWEKEPILFICNDEDKNIYLCLCSEIRNEQKWVISECCMDTLRSLVECRIDMYTALCLTTQLSVVTRDLNGTENSYLIRTAEADHLDLPKEGIFLYQNATLFG